MKLNLFIFYL